MKSRGALFKGDMMLRLLDGTKTQTRRLRGLEEVNKDDEPDAWRIYDETNEGGEYIVTLRHEFGTHVAFSPWRPGDEIYAKETYAFTCFNFMDKGTWHPNDRNVCCHYKAGCLYELEEKIEKWRPSIFMPKWASRYRARVTQVRCQRLQDISEEDAKAEGANREPECEEFLTQADHESGYTTPCYYASGFEHIWERVHGPGSWDHNPWVFAYTLERIK